MSKDFQQINTAFETAIKQMQTDLQYLVDKGTVSERFVNKQNAILRHLINYQQFTHEYISYLEHENAVTRIERRTQVQKLQNRIIAFEAVCILHGIMDFPMWLSWGKDFLIKQAVDAQHNNNIALPNQFKERIKDLPEQERKTLRKLLFKKEREDIRQILKMLNAKRKSITHQIESLSQKDKRTIKALIKTK